MRRIVLWGMSTLSALVLLFGYHTSTSSAQAGSSEVSTTAPTGTSSSSSSSASSATSTTVTGGAAQTRYGPVQVKLTITGGKVTAVDVVEYPNGNGHDQEINARALPILVSETLKAQSAKVDMVSGATYTSTGYTTSLQSALDKAGL